MGTIFLLGGQLFFDFITKKQGLCGYTYASGQAPLLAAGAYPNIVSWLYSKIELKVFFNFN